VTDSIIYIDFVMFCFILWNTETWLPGSFYRISQTCKVWCTFTDVLDNVYLF